MKDKLYEFCNKIVDEDELKIFKKIDEKCVNMNYLKKLMLFKKYKQNIPVKLHWIGNIYKDKTARDIFLNEREISLMSDGLAMLDKIRILEGIINKNNYNIFSDYKDLEKILYGSFSMVSLKSNLKLIMSELEYIKSSISEVESKVDCIKKR